MYTQVARAVRTPGAGVDVLAGMPAERKVLAIGESQSAFRLVTYADAVQPARERLRRLPHPQPLRGRRGPRGARPHDRTHP